MQGIDDREQIEIFISCRNLADLDLTSKSDPQVLVFLKSGNESAYQKIGQTEKQENNLNPNFQKTIELSFIFEIQQHIKFEVRDIDGNDFDLIGTFETTVGKLMGSKFSTQVGELTNQNKKRGQIIVRAEKTNDNTDVIHWQMKAKVESNRSIFSGHTKPVIRILRPIENNQFIKVHETEYYPKLECLYSLFTIKVQKLCHSNFNMPIKIEIRDYHKDKESEYMGCVQMNVEQLLKSEGMKINIVNEKKKVIGVIEIIKFKIVKQYSFLQFIRGGVQMGMILGIDYTGSNGDPHSTSSLHYLNHNNPNKLNHYQQSIINVGNIVINYDHDRLVPTFGFGGKVPSLSPETLHCFPINFDINNPQLFDIQGILHAYANSLNYVKLSGPTYFHHLLTNVELLCHNQMIQNIYVYTILLILTDGEIHDMEETKQVIVRMSQLPISIIIIGLGEGRDFSSMNQLDSDENVLTDNKNNKAVRDIVQFVEFSKYNNNVQALTQEVLRELPDQVVQFYSYKNLAPLPPQNFSYSTFQLQQQPQQPQLKQP